MQIKRDDLEALVRKHWPVAAEANGVTTDLDNIGPLIDGHATIGYSIRIFGRPPWPPNGRVPAAKEALWKALEGEGLEIDRAHDESVRGWKPS